jgi:hypothetical protein
MSCDAVDRLRFVRASMLSEYALVSRNEKASGGVVDLTTS